MDPKLEIFIAYVDGLPTSAEVKLTPEEASDLLKRAVLEISKWQIVNSCETVEDLQLAINVIAEEGKTPFGNGERDAKKLADRVPAVVSGEIAAKTLTRKYGIRQQSLYLKYYTELEKKEI